MKAKLTFDDKGGWLNLIPESRTETFDLLKIAGLLTGSKSLDHIAAADPEVKLVSHTSHGELTFSIC